MAATKANEVRKYWIDRIVSGESTVFEALTECDSSERKIVLNIRLASILSELENWDKYTAQNALIQKGFPNGSTLAFLAKSKSRLADFESILTSSHHRWVPNITFPEGYPFFGKIEEVLAQSDAIEYSPKPLEISEDNLDDSSDNEDDDIDNLLEDLGI